MFFGKTITIALIDGKQVEYDGCADTDSNFTKSKNYYADMGMEFIGIGYIYSINGVKQNFKYKHYFFSKSKQKGMKPIIKEETQDTILTKDITEQHIVVAVIDKSPCYLTKGNYETNDCLSFHILNDFNEKGNGYNYTRNENTTQKMVELAIKEKNKVAVFYQSDWKQALQWLIDNA